VLHCCIIYELVVGVETKQIVHNNHVGRAEKKGKHYNNIVRRRYVGDQKGHSVYAVVPVIVVMALRLFTPFYKQVTYIYIISYSRNFAAL